MHCPQCGFEQSSDEIRFCTKCGLDIGDVKDLLKFGSSESKNKRKKERQKAARQGFVMMIFGLCIAMILGALRENVSIPKIVIVLPVVVFMMGGLLRMILPSFSNESSSKKENVEPFINNLGTSKLYSEQVSDKILPQAQYRSPIDFAAKILDTNELVPIPSVTENTTRQLEKEIQQK